MRQADLYNSKTSLLWDISVWISRRQRAALTQGSQCPHAAIRPFVLTDEELAGIEGLQTQDVKAPKALAGMHFRVEISVLDCLGCGNCADVCPGKKGEKALTMVPFTCSFFIYKPIRLCSNVDVSS